MQSQKVLLEKFNMFSNFGTFSVSICLKEVELTIENILPLYSEVMVPAAV